LKKGEEIAKVRVKPESNDISDMKHNRYVRSSTSIAWQTAFFIQIASCYETKSSTGGTISAANLLPPQSCR